MDRVNTLGGDTHGHMFLSLIVANRDPRGHIFKSPDRTNTAQNESHKTIDETAVSPAGGLESRPEVTTQTTLARLAVVQEKTVGAAHPIVVEIVNNGHIQIEGGLINGGGKSG